jgi:hypothetical protein
MPRETIQQRLIRACEARGYRRVTKTSVSRYVVFERESGGARGFVYLGKAGACRTGATVGRSHPNEALKQNLLRGGVL